jgi:hypothetical protein
MINRIFNKKIRIPPYTYQHKTTPMWCLFVLAGGEGISQLTPFAYENPRFSSLSAAQKRCSPPRETPRFPDPFPIRIPSYPNQHKKTPMWCLFVLAGGEGFEPPNGGAKGRCLTTWRTPNRAYAMLKLDLPYQITQSFARSLLTEKSRQCPALSITHI